MMENKRESIQRQQQAQMKKRILDHEPIFPSRRVLRRLVDQLVQSEDEHVGGDGHLTDRTVAAPLEVLKVTARHACNEDMNLSSCPSS